MNIYGVRGFPTPDFTDERHCRTFSIPNTTIALAVFMGALWQLAQEKNWQQYGDMTPAEAADQFLNVIWEAYDDDEGICPTIPAPYWDTPGDVDDQQPEGETQPWYGILVASPALLADEELTFVENIGIWAIAGFIAYSGQIGAAIAFVPFAKRFVLQFKRHGLGAFVEIFVDGSLVRLMDTYSETEDIVDVPIIIDDDDDEHTLWVAVSEETNPAIEDGAFLQVVRKELAPGEVYPTNLRYNSGTDTVEQLHDGTWTTQPGQDPRHSTAWQLPPPAGDDPRCQAAANQVRFLNNVIDETLTNLAIAGDVVGLGTTLLPLFVELGPFAILFDLVLALASTLVSAGSTAIAAAFTNDVYDELLCIFFCNIESDGSVTADDLAAIETQIGTDIGGLVQVVLDAMLFLTGEVGLTNEGSIGDAPADCSICDCGWCFTVDFDLDDGGLVALDQVGWSSPSPAANYAPPWESVLLLRDSPFNDQGDFLRVTKSLPATTYTSIKIEYEITFDLPDGFPPEVALDIYVDATQIGHETNGGSGSQTLEWTGSRDDLTGLNILSVMGFASGHAPSGFMSLNRITYKGFGDNPFGTDNCP